MRTWGLGSLGSDHPTGRAGDIAGSNLGSLATRLRAGGAFAELHGVGASRHLHTAIGDTSSARAGRGTGADLVVNVNIPIYGDANADTVRRMDRHVRRVVNDELRQVFRDIQERA